MGGILIHPSACLLKRGADRADDIFELSCMRSGAASHLNDLHGSLYRKVLCFRRMLFYQLKEHPSNDNLFITWPIIG